MYCISSYYRTLTDKLTFNATNWNESREIYIVGVDDDIIRYSPYGGMINISSSSSSNQSYNATAELTLLVSDTDECKSFHSLNIAYSIVIHWYCNFEVVRGVWYIISWALNSTLNCLLTVWGIINYALSTMCYLTWLLYYIHFHLLAVVTYMIY